MMDEKQLIKLTEKENDLFAVGFFDYKFQGTMITSLLLTTYKFTFSATYYLN